VIALRFTQVTMQFGAQGGHKMKKWLPTAYKLANSNTLRLVWILLAITALVLGSGAPEMFGGGSGGGG